MEVVQGRADRPDGRVTWWDFAAKLATERVRARVRDAPAPAPAPAPTPMAVD